MKNTDRIELLEEAQTHISEAITLIEYALMDTEHERHAEAYIIAHLSNWIDSPSYDMGIQQYIEEIVGER